MEKTKKIVHFWYSACCIVMVLFYSKTSAQDTTKQIFTPLVNEAMTLNGDIVNQNNVSITNLSDIQITEAPGSVYVITQEDILANGYRTLTDVLMDIPGFNIASDVQNGTGIMLRGSWAAEAKLLVMIDGLIMNDMSYGSFVIGGRIPLLNVERIEIIKGASSSIYGGIAGLGVINIITKEGNFSKTNSFLAESGISNSSLSSTRLVFANSSKLNNDFEFSFVGGVCLGNRSNEYYTHPDTSETNFADSSATEDFYMQMNLKRKAFTYKMLYDDYNFQATYEGIYSQCKTFINDIEFDKKFNKFSFKSNINLKQQIPWNTQYGDPLVYDLQNLVTRRFSFQSILNYSPNDKLNSLLGVVYYNDFMRYHKPYLTLNSGNASDMYNAFAGFVELSYKSKFVNVFAGGRMDYYQTFNPNFAPRIALTKKFNFWHYKLIYGESFKIPTLQNINLAITNSEPIKPENIQDFQIELGAHLKNHELTLGGFYTTIQDVIVYGYDLTTLLESYVNNGDLTYTGGELSVRNNFGKLSIISSYSYYELLSSDGTDFVADTNSLSVGVLGMPKHKFTTRWNYKINETFTVSLNYIFQSSKVSVVQFNANTEEYGYNTYPSTSLIDLYVKARNIYSVFDLSLGIKNLLNTQNFYVYPISGGYPASLAMGRELFLQVIFNL